MRIMADVPCSGPSLPAAARSGPIAHAIFRLARTHRMRAAQLLRRAGLHPGQELVMMHLWENGPQRQTDLSAVVGSDSATMTRMVRRLEKAGFVRQFPCATDRRAVIVAPTPASQALRQEVEQIWQELERITVGELSEQDRAATLAALERLEGNLIAAREHCTATRAAAARGTAGGGGATAADGAGGAAGGGAARGVTARGASGGD
jgi:DNA-binding MarR family transcriptional regulator